MANAGKPKTILVGTTPQNISIANAGRRGLLGQNIGSVSVFLSGAQDVTTSGANRGYEWKSGADFPDTVSSGNLWAVADSDTNVLIWEIS